MAVLIERERRRSREVNLTPLIDVVFLLIVFFMLSTSFVVSESLELGLPGDGKADEKLLEDVMVLRVLSDGAVAYKQERMETNAFSNLIRDAVKAKPDQNVLLLSSPDVTVQQLVAVLDTLYLQGGRNVQIDHAPGSTIGEEVQFVE